MLAPHMVRAEDQAPLPAYFSGANEEGKTPAWPDPTARHGRLGDARGDGKGDAPASLDIPGSL
jgi:hypothetical protein